MEPNPTTYVGYSPSSRLRRASSPSRGAPSGVAPEGRPSADPRRRARATGPGFRPAQRWSWAASSVSARRRRPYCERLLPVAGDLTDALDKLWWSGQQLGLLNLAVAEYLHSQPYVAHVEDKAE